jgi:hypothetical protein
MKDGELVTVGRFIVNIKMIYEDVFPQDKNMKDLDRDEIFHELPRPDPFFDFKWRVKLDIRSATDL